MSLLARFGAVCLRSSSYLRPGFVYCEGGGNFALVTLDKIPAWATTITLSAPDYQRAVAFFDQPLPGEPA